MARSHASSLSSLQTRHKFNNYFQFWWTPRYGIISQGDKAVCGLCSEKVILGCRTALIRQHYETTHQSLCQKPVPEQRKMIASALQDRKKHLTPKTKYVIEEDTCAASFPAANVIAKHGKPFTDGEFLKEAWLATAPLLFEDFENKEKIIQRINDISLSRDTIKDRILKLAEYINIQQKNDIKSSPFISLCLNVINEATKSDRLVIFARYIVANNVKEELISLTTLTTTSTRGTDVYTIIKKTISEKEIELSKIVSITSDADPSIVGKKNSLMRSFQAYIGHPILEFHCIIEPQAFCAKGGITTLNDITAVVFKIVNVLSSQDLIIRKFDALLDEVNSVYNGLPLKNNVHWLSRGRILQRFVDSLVEIRQFLQNEGIKQYPQLMDVMWLSNLMFYTDLCQHFNEFNKKLQEPNKTILSMINLFRDFDEKLDDYSNDIATKTYEYFPNIKDFEIHDKTIENNVTEELISVIHSLIEEFAARFSEFKEISETLKLIIYPDTISVDLLRLEKFKWLEVNEIEMQLLEFQSSSIWVKQFINLRKELEIIENKRLTETKGNNKNVDTKIMETWNSIPESFSCLKKLAFAILTIFSSTHACESLISDINNIKNSLSDEDDSISAYLLLKVTKYDPDYKQLTSNSEHKYNTFFSDKSDNYSRIYG